MSIQTQNKVKENLQKAVQMHHAMHQKAGEMIELMKIVRADALKRQRQYHRMLSASNIGNLKEVKKLFAEMQTWKKYKINL
jgi:hypothetical protein